MAGASPVLDRYREDLLSSYRVLVEAKKGIAAAVRAVLEAESSARSDAERGSSNCHDARRRTCGVRPVLYKP